MKRLIFLVPLVGFVVIAGYLAVGLTKDPHTIPSVLINQEVPPFDLPPIKGQKEGFARDHLMGKVSLVNVFGSWCVACRAEHPFLMEIKKKNLVPVNGIDWREDDDEAGPAWLARFGDPYTRVGNDPHSEAAIAFGVTGAPETFVVDKKGVIRYKVIGPMTPQLWDSTIQPLIEELRRR